MTDRFVSGVNRVNGSSDCHYEEFPFILLVKGKMGNMDVEQLIINYQERR